jgi:mannose-6-phosphate isomerase-like protein (cupin superfamily)
MRMNQQAWVELLEKEGIKEIRVVEIAPNTNPGEHTHETAEVHVVLSGGFTIIAPEKRTCSVGDRLDITAGTTHTVVFGPEGCRLLIGVKHNYEH